MMWRLRNIGKMWEDQNGTHRNIKPQTNDEPSKTGDRTSIGRRKE
jgi:hypothetical protein